MKKIAFIAGLLLLCEQVYGVTSTDWNPATDTGVLIISCDDEAEPAFTTVATSLDFPMVFNLWDGLSGVKRTAALTAWRDGHDVGCHTDYGRADTMTAAQLHTMFNNSVTDLTSLFGSATGGPLASTWTPQSWVFKGNYWHQQAMDSALARFELIRPSLTNTGGDTSIFHDSPAENWGAGAIAGTYNAHPFQGAGRGIPILQTTRYLPWNRCCSKNDYNQVTGTITTDTLGLGAYLNDIKTNHLIGTVMIHPYLSGVTPYDFSADMLTALVWKARDLGGIWITTPRKLKATSYFSDIFSRSLSDTIYVESGATGRGTYADPTKFNWALGTTWDRVIKFKTDATYRVDQLVQTTTWPEDLYCRGNITVVGPSTLENRLGSTSGTNDGDTSSLRMIPSADGLFDDPAIPNAYARGNSQTWKNVTFYPRAVCRSDANKSTGFITQGANVTIDSCFFTVRGGAGLSRFSGSPHLTIRKSTFTIDTAVTAASAIELLGGTGDSCFVAVNNIFKTHGSATAQTLIYSQVAPRPTASRQDTIANNIFYNVGSNSTSNGIRYLAASASSPPYYNVYWGGNVMRNGGAALKIKLLSASAMTWDVANDTLMDFRITLHAAGIDSLKSYVVNYDIGTGDTAKWGGVPLATIHGSAARWGSIGLTQYTENPFLANRAITGKNEYARYRGPWFITRMITNGVLPAATDSSADQTAKTTWYDIAKPTTESDMAQYKLWMDEYYKLPYASRKAHWNVLGQSTAFQSFYGHYNWLDSITNHGASLGDSLNPATWHNIPKPLNESDELQLYIYRKAYFDLPEATRHKMFWNVLAQGSNFEDWNGYWPVQSAVDAATYSPSDEYSPASWFDIPKPRNRSDLAMLDFYLDEYMMLNDTERDKMYWNIKQ